ncbi:MAG TPA: hypothetical protein PLW65_23815 [Pseudomonadota bacterium]|nr:hypothetical protein [Pseudomonadota bacterium]
MAEFDFAPRPPKQSDQSDKPSPFGDASANQADNQAGNQAAKPGATAGQPRKAARRSPGETEGMLAGLMSMATTMGMARFTNAHVDPISSPTGLLGLVRSAFSAKHGPSDDHNFNLDLSRHGSPGGGIGGMATGIGMVGGPLQSLAKRESTSAAMKAIGGLARGAGGGLGAALGGAGKEARHHMHWLDKGVKTLYKVER